MGGGGRGCKLGLIVISLWIVTHIDIIAITVISNSSVIISVIIIMRWTSYCYGNYCYYFIVTTIMIGLMIIVWPVAIFNYR